MLRRKKIMIHSLTIVAVLILMASSVLAESKWGKYSFDFVDHAPNPRFAIYDPGTPGDLTDDLVLDKSTDLIWARNGDLAGASKTWQEAHGYCRHDVTLGNTKGWRLPTIEELQSVLDPSQSTWPYLPVGHPFSNHCTGQCGYWSSTTSESSSTHAYVHYYYDEEMNGTARVDKTATLPYGNYYVWPVLGGNGYATGNWDAESCPSGQVDCGGTCIDPLKDKDYCGADAECLGGAVCGDGYICAGGTCQLSCQSGLTDCSGICVDTDTDESNCGSCDNVCSIGEMCLDGDCDVPGPTCEGTLSALGRWCDQGDGTVKRYDNRAGAVAEGGLGWSISPLGLSLQ